MINIAGKNKAEVLAALYNASQPLGLGFLHFDPTPWTAKDAQEYIDLQYQGSDRLYFDYVKGRVMKVDLGKDEFSPRLYDRDNGDGAALNALTKAGLV